MGQGHWGWGQDLDVETTTVTQVSDIGTFRVEYFTEDKGGCSVLVCHLLQRFCVIC
jgi:hypothetical protein